MKRHKLADEIVGTISVGNKNFLSNKVSHCVFFLNFKGCCPSFLLLENASFRFASESHQDPHDHSTWAPHLTVN